MDFTTADGIPVLERTPATLRALLAGLPGPWVTGNEGPETFSAFDNVGHLVHGERTDWIPRAKLILAQGTNRRFEPFDRFAHVRESAGKSLIELLATWVAHDLGHLAQISRVMAKQYRDAVGPWRAFLPVLDR